MTVHINAANNKCPKVYNGDALDKDEDSEQTATDGEGTDSESEEVIAFLTGKTHLVPRS